MVLPSIRFDTARMRQNPGSYDANRDLMVATAMVLTSSSWFSRWYHVPRPTVQVPNCQPQSAAVSAMSLGASIISLD